MDKYIVTVETNLDREFVCGLFDTRDLDGRKRQAEVSSKEGCLAFVQISKGEFPFAQYHIYRLVEVDALKED